MRTLWAVSSGDYEQHETDFVCATRELAVAAAAKLGIKGAEIAETVLYETLDDVYEYPVYEVALDADGSELRRHKWMADSSHRVDEELTSLGWHLSPSKTPPVINGRKLPTFEGRSIVSFDEAERLAREAMALPVEKGGTCVKRQRPGGRP